jgi:phosphate transport system protein
MTPEGPGYARQAFTAEMQNLEHDLLQMGSLAENMVSQAVDALTQLDPGIAMVVIRRDDDIDKRDIEIESNCLRILILQSPAASDLREIGAVMKIITDVERVGDLSVDIAKVALKIEKEMGRVDYVDLPRIANVARSMIRQSLEAFVKRDTDLALKVCEMDDEVDDLYRSIRNQIHEHMRASPDDVVSASWLLLALHHIERIADHAVNIAERVNFMVTGQLTQLATSHKSDSGGDG